MKFDWNKFFNKQHKEEKKNLMKNNTITNNNAKVLNVAKEQDDMKRENIVSASGGDINNKPKISHPQKQNTTKEIVAEDKHFVRIGQMNEEYNWPTNKFYKFCEDELDREYPNRNFHKRMLSIGPKTYAWLEVIRRNPQPSWYNHQTRQDSNRERITKSMKVEMPLNKTKIFDDPEIKMALKRFEEDNNDLAQMNLEIETTAFPPANVQEIVAITQNNNDRNKIVSSPTSSEEKGGVNNSKSDNSDDSSDESSDETSNGTTSSTTTTPELHEKYNKDKNFEAFKGAHGMLGQKYKTAYKRDMSCSLRALFRIYYYTIKMDEKKVEDDDHRTEESSMETLKS